MGFRLINTRRFKKSDRTLKKSVYRLKTEPTDAFLCSDADIAHLLTTDSNENTLYIPQEL